jgi:hypothetical protein
MRRVMVRLVLTLCDIGVSKADRKRMRVMLWAIAVVLLVLWVLGFVAFHVTTGFIHLLLLVALVVVAIQLLSGRRGAI